MTTNKNTLNESIINIINDQLNQQPQIEEITIHKIHDNSHVDVKTVEGEHILTYLPCIANNLSVGHHGLLIPIGQNRYYVITK